jgi:transcriptional regulator with XRE-family HTH domain
MNSIGERIAQLRKNSGFTQEILANTLGVSPQTVSKWETGTTMPDILLLPREERAEETCFVYPGAIQYFGPTEVCDATTVTLALEKGE